jgi:hypothetical protein
LICCIEDKSGNERKQIAATLPHVFFTGRLGTCKYYNMDQVVAQSLTLFKKILQGAASKEIEECSAVLNANIPLFGVCLSTLLLTGLIGMILLRGIIPDYGILTLKAAVSKEYCISQWQ